MNTPALSATSKNTGIVYAERDIDMVPDTAKRVQTLRVTWALCESTMMAPAVLHPTAQPGIASGKHTLRHRYGIPLVFSPFIGTCPVQLFNSERAISSFMISLLPP